MSAPSSLIPTAFFVGDDDDDDKRPTGSGVPVFAPLPEGEAASDQASVGVRVTFFNHAAAAAAANPHRLAQLDSAIITLSGEQWRLIHDRTNPNTNDGS